MRPATDADGRQTGNDTTGLNVFIQCLFNRAAEARKLYRVGRHQSCIQLFKFVEEAVNNGIGRGLFLALGIIQNLLNHQVVVGHAETVPEVFTASDGDRINTAIVGLAAGFCAVIFRQQFFENKTDDHKQGVRKTRESELLPLFNRFEEFTALVALNKVIQPVIKRFQICIGITAAFGNFRQGFIQQGFQRFT